MVQSFVCLCVLFETVLIQLLFDILNNAYAEIYVFIVHLIEQHKQMPVLTNVI